MTYRTPESYEANTLLVRTKGGKMVHVRGCSYASWGKPWIWAEGLSRMQILLGTMFLDVGFCKRCNPLDVVEERQS